MGARADFGREREIWGGDGGEGESDAGLDGGETQGDSYFLFGFLSQNVLRVYKTNNWCAITKVKSEATTDVVKSMSYLC